MRFTHYSHEPLVKIHDTRSQLIGHKPIGLWLSVGDAWAEWCTENNFAVESLVYQTIIETTQEANILFLESAEAIIIFSKEFGVGFRGINWRDVSRRYDGIVIAPYQWECRLNPRTSWYYGWDCASGCVWNSRSVRIDTPGSSQRPPPMGPGRQA